MGKNQGINSRTCDEGLSSLLKKSGSGPIFGNTASFSRKAQAENLRLTLTLLFQQAIRSLQTKKQFTPIPPAGAFAPQLVHGTHRLIHDPFFRQFTRSAPGVAADGYYWISASRCQAARKDLARFPVRIIGDNFGKLDSAAIFEVVSPQSSKMPPGADYFCPEATWRLVSMRWVWVLPWGRFRRQSQGLTLLSVQEYDALGSYHEPQNSGD